MTALAAAGDGLEHGLLARLELAELHGQHHRGQQPQEAADHPGELQGRVALCERAESSISIMGKVNEVILYRV